MDGYRGTSVRGVIGLGVDFMSSGATSCTRRICLRLCSHPLQCSHRQLTPAQFPLRVLSRHALCNRLTPSERASGDRGALLSSHRTLRKLGKAARMLIYPAFTRS